jgi:putative flippase GtrA
MANADSKASIATHAGKKVLHSRGAKLFGRNTIASIAAFAVDMALLGLLVELGGLPYMIAAAAAFVIAMSAQYGVSRVWVFKDSDRGLAKGYLYFAVNMGIGLAVTLAAFWLMLELLGIHYLLARAVASIVAGILVFFLNAIFNFREL